MAEEFNLSVKRQELLKRLSREQTLDRHREISKQERLNIIFEVILEQDKEFIKIILAYFVACDDKDAIEMITTLAGDKLI